MLPSQIRELQHGVSQPTAFIVSGFTEGFVAFGVALFYSWKLTLVVLAILPFSATVLILISRGYQAHIDAQNIYLTSASKTANNAISNPALIKCFCTAAFETGRYTTAVNKAAAHSLRQARVTAAQMGAMGFLMFAMFLLGSSSWCTRF
jgi:ATP-binding cassette, subfamily B (MDR/TAP), member 1